MSLNTFIVIVIPFFIIWILYHLLKSAGYFGIYIKTDVNREIIKAIYKGKVISESNFSHRSSYTSIRHTRESVKKDAETKIKRFLKQKNKF